MTHRHFSDLQYQLVQALLVFKHKSQLLVRKREVGVEELVNLKGKLDLWIEAVKRLEAYKNEEESRRRNLLD